MTLAVSDLERSVDFYRPGRNCGRAPGGGLSFEHPPVDQAWVWREARLRDPDGNRLCLFHAGENRLNPPWRLPDG